MLNKTQNCYFKTKTNFTTFETIKVWLGWLGGPNYSIIESSWQKYLFEI